MVVTTTPPIAGQYQETGGKDINIDILEVESPIGILAGASWTSREHDVRRYAEIIGEIQHDITSGTIEFYFNTKTLGAGKQIVISHTLNSTVDDIVDISIVPPLYYLEKFVITNNSLVPAVAVTFAFSGRKR